MTGFEPFGNHSLNPSAEVARRLDGASIAGHTVCSEILPVTGSVAGNALQAAVERHHPSMVLGLGLASGRARLAVERVAINVMDFSIPDNAGTQSVDLPVVPDGPAAYFSTLPVKAILSAWLRAGIPGYVSNTAGTYICNQVMYGGLALGAEHGFRAGFIHLPEFPEAVASGEKDLPSVALDVMVSAIRIALEVGLTVTDDLRVSAGAVS